MLRVSCQSSLAEQLLVTELRRRSSVLEATAWDDQAEKPKPKEEPKKEEPFILLAYDDENLARKVCAYVAREMTLASNYKARVVENPNVVRGDISFGNKRWQVIMDPGSYGYGAVDPVRQAARDFAAGYNTAKGEPLPPPEKKKRGPYKARFPRE